MSVDTHARAPFTTDPAPDPDRSADQIERDIQARRERLITTVDQITERVKPANMAGRAKEKATGLVIDQEHGGVRVNRVLPIAAGVAGLAALVIARKALHRPTRTQKVKAKGHEAVDNAAELRDKLVELFTHASDVARARANTAWDATADARHRVSDVASNAADTTVSAAQATREHAASAAEVAKEQAVAAAEAAQDAAKHSNKRASKLWKKTSKRLPWG